jgi:uncharacterized membrane protein
MAYGQTNVHGGSRGGEFLTGNMTFFTFKTVVPCYPTNVTTPLDTALKARNWTSLSAARTITVKDGNGDDVTYDTNAEYTSAYNKQQNLNTFLSVFATGANPVIVDVSAEIVDNDPAATLMSGGVTANTVGAGLANEYVLNAIAVYTINIATEKTPSWLMTGAGPGDNEAGYQFMGIKGLNSGSVTALSTTATTPAGPQDAGAVAIDVAAASGGVFVTTSGNAARNIIGKASDVLPSVV